MAFLPVLHDAEINQTFGPCFYFTCLYFLPDIYIYVSVSVTVAASQFRAFSSFILTVLDSMRCDLSFTGSRTSVEDWSKAAGNNLQAADCRDH